LRWKIILIMVHIIPPVLSKLPHDWPPSADYHNVTDQSDPETAAQAYYSCNTLVHDRAQRFPTSRALGSFVQDANGRLALEEYDFSTFNGMVNQAAHKLLALRGFQPRLKGGQDHYVGMLGYNSLSYLVNEFALGRL
jgi:hypothetical protein